MKNALLVTHHPALSTGYGRVGREVRQALRAAGAAVHWLGMTPDFTIAAADDVSAIAGDMSVLPARIAQEIERRRPDLLLTIGDPWMSLGVETLHRGGCRWAAYFPVDGQPFPRAWRNWLAAIDIPIVCSQFGQQVLLRSTGRCVPVVHHGVDLDVFRPIDKAVAKSRVGLAGKFVVGTIANNQQRKNLPALMRAFARFAQGKPDVILYLHTPLQSGCWNLLDLAGELGIHLSTRATLHYDHHFGIDDQDLATIYNSFDVFALPTMAEGFGLPLLEAQACGVATIATDCLACTELLPDPFQRVPVAAWLTMADNVNQAVIDEAALAMKIETLYEQPNRRAEIAQTGVRFAREMDWKSRATKLVQLLSTTP